MLVIVEHVISDKETFFKQAETAVKGTAGVKLIQTMPAEDHSRAICLWEAETPDRVRNFLEPMIGNVSKNTYYPVDTKNAIGLPGRAAGA
jgi:hypothetical protein